MSGSKASPQPPQPCQEECASTSADSRPTQAYPQIHALLDDLMSQSVDSSGCGHGELSPYIIAFIEHSQSSTEPLEYSLAACDSPDYIASEAEILVAFESWLAAEADGPRPSSMVDMPAWLAMTCANVSCSHGPPACVATQLVLSLLRYMPRCRSGPALRVMEQGLLTIYSLMTSLAADEILCYAAWMPRYVSHVLITSLQFMTRELEGRDVDAAPGIFAALGINIVETLEDKRGECAIVLNYAVACICAEECVLVLMTELLDCSPGAAGSSSQWATLGARLLRVLLRYEHVAGEAKKLIAHLVTNYGVVIEKLMLHTRATPVDTSNPYNEIFWHCACHLATESSSWPVFRECRALAVAMLALTRPLATAQPEACNLVANFVGRLAMDPDCFKPFKPYATRSLPAIICGFETLCNIVTGTSVANRRFAEAAVTSMLAEHHKDAMLVEIWEMGFGRGVALLLGMWGVAGWQLRSLLIHMLYLMHERVWSTDDKPTSSLGPAAWVAMAGMLKDVRNAPGCLESGACQRLAYIVKGCTQDNEFSPQAKPSLRAQQAHVEVAHILMHALGRMPKEDYGIFGFKTGWGLCAPMLGGALGALVEPADYAAHPPEGISTVTASITALAEVLLAQGQHPEHCGCANGFPCAAIGVCALTAPGVPSGSSSIFTATLRRMSNVVPILELLGESFFAHQPLTLHFVERDHVVHAHKLVTTWAQAVNHVDIAHQLYPIALDGFYNATHVFALLLAVAASGRAVQPDPTWLPDENQMMQLNLALDKSLTETQSDEWHPRIMGAFSYIAQCLLLIPQHQTPWSGPMAACLLHHLTIFLANSKVAVEDMKSKAPPAEARIILAQLRSRLSVLAGVVSRALEATSSFYTPPYEAVQRLAEFISDAAAKKPLLNPDGRRELKALLDRYDDKHKADAADQAAAALLEDEAAATQSADAAKQRRKEKKARQKKSKAAISAADGPSASGAEAAVTASSLATGTTPGGEAVQEAAPSTAPPASQPVADSTSPAASTKAPMPAKQPAVQHGDDRLAASSRAAAPDKQPAAQHGNDKRAGPPTQTRNAASGRSGAAALAAPALPAAGDAEATGQRDDRQPQARSQPLAADPAQRPLPTATGTRPARAGRAGAAPASSSTPRPNSSSAGRHDVGAGTMLQQLDLNTGGAAEARPQAASAPRTPARYDPLQHVRTGGRSGPAVAAPQRLPAVSSHRQQAGQQAASAGTARPQPTARASIPAAQGAPASARPAAVVAEPARSPALDMTDMECPITQELMTDPVIASDGHTYERSAIEQWLSTHNTSPMTNEPLADTNLISNVLVRRLIASYRGTQ